MADMVREVQSVTAKPLSIDSPDYAQTKAALEAYDLDRAGGRKPILNSISAMRTNMFDLYGIQPFMPILLTVETEVDGGSHPNRTGAENYGSAQYLLGKAHECGIPNGDCIFDPGIAPIGSDTEGMLKMAIESLALMHDDPALAGTHKSVGLSNFTVMLPPKKGDGSPVKGPLENAFLTLAMPLGLDFIIGSVKRNYQFLPEDHPALMCLRDVLGMDGYDCIMRVMEFYA
jgi:cobalamin-dependent methionine synthase I